VSNFVCPLCGSCYFNTISRYDASPLVRRCKGDWTQGGGYTGCDYVWTSDRDRLHGLENLQEPQTWLDPLDPSLWRVEDEEPPEFDLGGEG
jgi:hypothetical protein